MTASLTPHQAQRRTMQLLNYEDGLWDVLLGLVFLELSLYPVTRRLLGPVWNMVLFLAVLAILVVGLTLVRRIVSTPRLGRVRMRRTPQKAVLAVLLFATFLGTLGLVALTLRSPEWISRLPVSNLLGWAGDLSVDIVVTVLLVGVFSLMGYLFGVVRLFFYGWIIGLGNLASTAMTLYLGTPFNLPLAIASLIIILTGLVLLARFLRKYDVVDIESPE